MTAQKTTAAEHDRRKTGDRLPADAGVYVHFPFCRRRCHYCDFNTYAVPEIPIERYTAAVIAELRARGHRLGGRRLVSVFFGGGTPGLWGAEPVRRVMQAIRESVGPWTSDAELTIEVNPGECDENLLRDYREISGLNRVSFGVQSLTDSLLRSMDRIHSAAEAHEAMAAVKRAGYTNWSADVMFGLPGQTKTRWQEDLHAVLAHEPPHVSAYNLMLEPTTPLYVRVRDGKVKLPSDRTQIQMMELGWETLQQHGYQRYEISNFCQPGRQSVHNTLYWTGRPYLAVGAGAHSFLPPQRGHAESLGERTANARTYGEYMNRALAESEGPEPTVVFREDIDAETHLVERIMTGLRLAQGVALSDLQAVVGIDPRERFAQQIHQLESENLLRTDSDTWTLTEQAIPISDAIFQRFF